MGEVIKLKPRGVRQIERLYLRLMRSYGPKLERIVSETIERAKGKGDAEDQG